MADQQRATGEPLFPVDPGTRRSARPSLLPDDGDAGVPARAHLLPLVALNTQLSANSLSGFGYYRPQNLVAGRTKARGVVRGPSCEVEVRCNSNRSLKAAPIDARRVVPARSLNPRTCYAPHAT